MCTFGHGTSSRRMRPPYICVLLRARWAWSGRHASSCVPFSALRCRVRSLYGLSLGRSILKATGKFLQMYQERVQTLSGFFLSDGGSEGARTVITIGADFRNRPGPPRPPATFRNPVAQNSTRDLPIHPQSRRFTSDGRIEVEVVPVHVNIHPPRAIPPRHTAVRGRATPANGPRSARYACRKCVRRSSPGRDPFLPAPAPQALQRHSAGCQTGAAAPQEVVLRRIGTAGVGEKERSEHEPTALGPHGRRVRRRPLI